MLLRDLVDIKNGRVITKDVISKDDDFMSESERAEFMKNYNREMDIAVKNGNSAEIMRLKRLMEKAVQEGQKIGGSKTKDADYKNYYDVGKDVGLSGEKLIQYVEYMRQRWPEKEKSPLELSGYCKEWARRFARGDAWKLSDLSGQRILERMGITDSKSTKDQIAELECQKEQVKKMGYGTDAYDAHIEELKKQEDTFTQDPKTKDEKIPDDPFIKNQIIVAKKTLKMANPMLGVMGGMTKEEARQILKKYGIKVEDSKTKDDYTYPEDFIQFGWNLRQNGSKLIATRGTLKYEGSPYEIVPKLKRWLTDYTLEQKYGSKDSDIIINVIEKDDEEAFDLIHYNGYNIKLVKETGEFDIYDLGGAIIGHTATLELAKIFIDNKGRSIIGRTE
jgi:hypothetical protein